MGDLNNMKKLLEQLVPDKLSKHRPKKPSSDNNDKLSKHRPKKPSSDNSQTTTKPQVQPTDDGLPKPSTNKSITIRLLYRNGTDVQDENFILAVQNALNKGGDDYSSKNIFK